MNGRGVSRSAALLLLGFGLLLGLLAMHGLSASPTPIHVSEPVLATHHGTPPKHIPTLHNTPAAYEDLATHDSPAVRDDLAAMAGGGVSGHLSGCEGGTVCFALLGGMLLLAFALPRLMGVLPPPAPLLWGRAVRSGFQRARPPDLYSLAVLRL